MIDWARITDLRGEVGDDAFTEVVDLFLEEMSEAMTRLLDGLDQTRLANELHFMRGAALNLGLQQFCVLSQRLEHAARTRAPVNLDPLVECYAQSRQALLAGLPALQGTV